jgi:hypothetical protein
MISEMAACTGFRTEITPTAPTRMSSAEVIKIMMLGKA